MRRIQAWTLCAASALTTAVTGQTAGYVAPPPTRFDQGPTRQASLMEGCGTAQFKIQCDSQPAADFFNQGIAQLHGGWMFEAERSFRQVAALEPNCAMAYWGIALANAAWPDRAAYFADEALYRRSHAGPDDLPWIDALAAFYELPLTGAQARHDAREAKERQAEAAPIPYEVETYTFAEPEPKRRQKLIDAFRAICARRGNDVEAVAMLAQQHWLSRVAGHPARGEAVADQLLDAALKRRMFHPAQQYRVRLRNDTAAEIQRAVQAAQYSVQAGPRIAARWRRAGDLLAHLGMHVRAATYLEAAVRLDREQARRDRVMPFAVHDAAATLAQLNRSLIHAGRIREALATAREMISLPRHPVHNRLGDPTSLAGAGVSRFVATCAAYRLGQELEAMAATGQLTGGGRPGSRLLVKVDLALALLALGRPEVAARVVADVPTDRVGWEASQSRSKRDPAIIRSALRRLAVAQALAGGAGTTVAELREAGLPSVIAADLLGGQKRFIEALQILDEAARRHPRRLELLWRGVAWAPKAGIGRAELATRFAALREVGGTADHDHPSLAVLADVARRMGAPVDWRLPRKPGPMERIPDLASMGPARWQPHQPHDWALQGSTGKEIRLQDYRGKPLLVIIYLGFGCLHCVEQLQAFHPHYGKYRAAGIDIAAIGLDTVAGTKKSVTDLEASDRFRFPLLSDRKLRVFHEWLAFDDFEHMPLHGTYLIDGKGQMLWQDIDHEPFSRPKWLLAECQRLLAQDR